MLKDIEMSSDELEEFCEYHELEMPEILDFDGCDVKINVTSDLKYCLDRDNIAYWDDGELLWVLI